MRGGADDLDAALVGAVVRPRALKRGQEGVMDVCGEGRRAVRGVRVLPRRRGPRPQAARRQPPRAHATHDALMVWRQWRSQKSREKICM